MELNDTIVYAGGRFQRYDDARVGLLTHGLNYGTGCFEGIRGYWNAEDGELYLLQLREHYERLHASARILLMKLPHTVDELIALTVELCARNRFEQNIYVRPLIFKAAEDVGVRLTGVPDAFSICPLPFDRYFDATTGLRCCVSSWRRIDDTMAPARAKITGAYINSALAKSEAQMNGFDEVRREGRRAVYARRNAKRSRRHHAAHGAHLCEERVRAHVRRASSRPQRALHRRRGVLFGFRGRPRVRELGRSSADRRRQDGSHHAQALRDVRAAHHRPRARVSGLPHRDLRGPRGDRRVAFAWGDVHDWETVGAQVLQNRDTARSCYW
jgi:hypothetical protein